MVSSMFSITLVTLLLETVCALELDEESHGKLTTKSLFWAPKGGRTRFGTIHSSLESRPNPNFKTQPKFFLILVWLCILS